MSTDPLLTSLTRAWERAVATTGARELPREYVNVILPLMPESAPDILRALRDIPGFGEGWLLREHAPLLARYAPDLFLERVGEIPLPFPRAVLVADAALGLPLADRGPFRARALALLAAETHPAERLLGLLGWARAEEPGPAADAMLSEARALLSSVDAASVSRVRRRLKDPAVAHLRADFLAHVESLPEADLEPELILTRARLGPPDRRVALALRAIEVASHREGRINHYIYTAMSTSKLVGFAPVRPWFERYLRELDTARDLSFLVRSEGAHMPPEMLENAAQRARALCAESWRLAPILAEVASHHADGRDALRSELRGLVARVVGEPVRGHSMDPSELEDLINVDFTRARVAMEVSAIFEGDERRYLQRRALELVEAADTGVEQQYAIDQLEWDEFGPVLDPSLYAEAARVALGIRHRPSALKALGKLVAALPESSRHLALLGLARLADGTPPEGLAGALDALDAAARLPPRARDPRRAADRAEPPWTAADERSLARYTAAVIEPGHTWTQAARESVAALTHAAARRAATQACALSSRNRLDVALLLLRCPWLGDAPERSALLATALEDASDRFVPRGSFAQIAQELESVCGERDPAWSARVAAFFETHRWDVESLLDAIAAFASALRRLGGAELPPLIAARLRAPIATTEVARPWALAAQGAFEA
ncbi:MAG: hypothetical protein R3A52_00105 [Polyangiales bacterium]